MCLADLSHPNLTGGRISTTTGDRGLLQQATSCAHRCLSHNRGRSCQVARDEATEDGVSSPVDPLSAAWTRLCTRASKISSSRVPGSLMMKLTTSVSSVIEANSPPLCDTILESFSASGTFVQKVHCAFRQASRGQPESRQRNQVRTSVRNYQKFQLLAGSRWRGGRRWKTFSATSCRTGLASTHHRACGREQPKHAPLAGPAKLAQTLPQRLQGPISPEHSLSSCWFVFSSKTSCQAWEHAFAGQILLVALDAASGLALRLRILFEHKPG